MGRLSGRRCVISDVSTEVGRAIATSFSDEGGRVIGVGPSEAVGRRVESALRAARRDFTFVRANVSLDDDVVGLARAAQDLLGGVDVIVNNAGITSDKPLLETTDAEWSTTLDSGPKSTFLVARELGRLIPDSGGSIINIAAAGGLVALPGMAAYCASNGAIVAMTKSMAVDFAPSTRVNALCPDEDVAGDRLLERHGTPDDVAAFAVFLASNESSFVTGGIFAVDGGLTAV